ncbi:hypothetical protein ACW189_05865 [Limosilactobacillus fermentum]
MAQGIQKTSVRQISQESGIFTSPCIHLLCRQGGPGPRSFNRPDRPRPLQTPGDDQKLQSALFATSAGDSQHLLARRHHQ